MNKYVTSETDSLLYVTDFVTQGNTIKFYGDLVDVNGDTLQESVCMSEKRRTRFYPALKEIGVIEPEESEEIILGHVIVWEEICREDYLKKIISGKTVRRFRNISRAKEMQKILKNYEKACLDRLN